MFLAPHRCTDDFPFIMMADRQPVAHSAWDDAVQCFVGGLLGQVPVTAEELTQRSQVHNMQIQRQLDQLAALRPVKKLKGLGPS